MRFAYPAIFEDQADGSILVRFPDVPEALTEGGTEAEAAREAADALVAALGGYVNDRRDFPAPSRPTSGRRLIPLRPLVAAKLALYQAMRTAGLSNVALAKRLGVSETVVRRLVDLDHRSRIGQVEAALELLGRRLVVEVEDRPAA